MNQPHHPMPGPALIAGLVTLSALSTSLGQSPAMPDLAPASNRKALTTEEEAEKAVTVRLVSESTAIVPGRTAMLGVTFEIAKGWNLYWRNAGDSGLPITVKFEAPEGIVIGEPQWPTPERHVLPGDLLDYIYTRRVTLLFPVEASPSLKASINAVPTSISIKAEAKYLVCKEACVPGSREVSLTLPVASEASISSDAALFSAARDRLPRTASEQPAPIISAAWEGRTLRISCTGADELTFFPYEGDAQPEDALTQGHAQRDTLRLAYTKADTGAPITGVVVAHRLGKTTYHLLQAPPVPPSG